MRNLFDQYHQPENRLTHALASTLAHERALVRPFLRWLGVADVPHERDIQIVEQQMPGVPLAGDEPESEGLPDLCFFNEDGWAVLVEVKVQARLRAAQLHRHYQTATRCGYANPQLIALTVDPVKQALPHHARPVEWREVYRWFRGRAGRHWWAGQFIAYMHVFESYMSGQNDTIRGTLTMFDGFHFDAENPCTYREGKRLIRLLGDELRQRRDLREFGLDPHGSGRPAITGRGQSTVWDFIPLKAARNAKAFTDYPHLAMNAGREEAGAAVIVPNGVKGGFRTKLRDIGFHGFHELMTEIEKRMRPVVRQSKDACPTIHLLQRRFRGRRSVAHSDGRMSVDLRTTRREEPDGVKYQPEWLEAIYELLVNKRSNIQVGVAVRFSYECPKVRSRRATDLFAKSWIATAPLIDFVLR